MALKQNGRLAFQMPLRHRGGSASVARVAWGLTEIRNQATGEGITSKLAGVPAGHLAPSAWMLPQRSGAMSAYSTEGITLVDSTLQLLAGINLDGTTSLVLDPPGPLNLVLLASLTGSDALSPVIAGTPALIGVGQLALGAGGTLSVSQAGTLSAGIFIAGSDTLTIGGSATLAAAVGISGSTTLIISQSGTATGLGVVVGTATGTIDGSLSLTTGRNLTGSTTFSLVSAGAGQADGFISSSAVSVVTVTDVATIYALGRITGSSTTASGELTVDSIWSRVLVNGRSAEATLVDTLKTARQTFAVAASG